MDGRWSCVLGEELPFLEGRLVSLGGGLVGGLRSVSVVRRRFSFGGEGGLFQRLDGREGEQRMLTRDGFCLG